VDLAADLVADPVHPGYPVPALAAVEVVVGELLAWLGLEVQMVQGQSMENHGP